MTATHIRGPKYADLLLAVERLERRVAELEDTKRIQRDERARLMKSIEEARDRYISSLPGNLIDGRSSGAVFYNDAIRLIGDADA